MILFTSCSGLSATGFGATLRKLPGRGISSEALAADISSFNDFLGPTTFQTYPHNFFKAENNVDTPEATGELDNLHWFTTVSRRSPQMVRSWKNLEEIVD